MWMSSCARPHLVNESSSGGVRSMAKRSRNFASTFEPSPVSTRMFLPCARISRQFSPSWMRFFSSAGQHFSHRTFGTTPNIAPPSSRNRPSVTGYISNFPSFIRQSHSSLERVTAHGTLAERSMPGRSRVRGAATARPARARQGNVPAGPARSRSQHHRLLVSAKNFFERRADLAQRGLSLDRFEEIRHQVLIPRRGFLQRLQSPRHLEGITTGPQRGQPVRLSLLHLRPDLQDRDTLPVRLHVLVDADDDPLFPFHFPLVALRRVQYFPLGESLFDRTDHAAHLIEPPEVLAGPFFQTVRQRLDIVGAAQRIHGVRDLALVRDDLLGAQRQLDRLLGR